MKSNRKKSIKKIATILVGLFFALFIFRILYSYNTNDADDKLVVNNVFDELSDITSMERKNYATKKHLLNQGVLSTSIDQKYEKIANINTLSNEFNKEEKAIRNQVINHKGLIQFENKSGNEGHRKLQLIIGIPPENFDSIYQSVIKIGEIQTKRITKKDKTNEYKELNARKESLEKIRTSLIALKSKGGKIEEYIQLENRILDIDQQLQGLGVSLGNFDDENEFCTVKVTLKETIKTQISVIHRIKVALEWTITNFLMTIASLAFISLFSYLLVLIIEKSKKL